jgi:hypothetical protein
LDNSTYKSLAFAVLLAAGLGVGRLAAYSGWWAIGVALGYGVFCAAVMTVLEVWVFRDVTPRRYWEEKDAAPLDNKPSV